MARDARHKEYGSMVNPDAGNAAAAHARKAPFNIRAG